MYNRAGALTTNLGGGGGNSGFYGTLTRASHNMVFELMGLGQFSIFLDIGAGLGIPLLHAALLGVTAIGVENDVQKCKKAQCMISSITEECRDALADRQPILLHAGGLWVHMVGKGWEGCLVGGLTVKFVSHPFPPEPDPSMGGGHGGVIGCPPPSPSKQLT